MTFLSCQNTRASEVMTTERAFGCLQCDSFAFALVPEASPGILHGEKQ